MSFYRRFELVQVRAVDKKVLEDLSVAVLSVTTPTKQKDACFPLHVPANPSTHQLTKASKEPRTQLPPSSDGGS